MRNWNETLYMDAMPGRYGRVETWLRELEENRINRIVCLTSEEEIATQSRSYLALRESSPRDGNRIVIETPTTQVPVFDFPIRDFGAPTDDEAPRFWLLARETADAVRGGERVFIHCGAGVGRTGTFAVAVLVELGIDYEQALQEIRQAEAGPEVPAQRELLTRRVEELSDS